MIPITIISCSFIVAIIGIITSNRISGSNKAKLGLTKTGVVLLIVSSIGLTFGVVKEIQDSGAEKVRSIREEQRTLMLQEIYRSLTGVAAEIHDPELKAKVDSINDRISRTYSKFRDADFTASDFSDSNFRLARFDNADFTQTWFEGARLVNANLRNVDLRGADLSTAIIDENTILPVSKP